MDGNRDPMTIFVVDHRDTKGKSPKIHTASWLLPLCSFPMHTLAKELKISGWKDKHIILYHPFKL